MCREVVSEMQSEREDLNLRVEQQILRGKALWQMSLYLK